MRTPGISREIMDSARDMLLVALKSAQDQVRWAVGDLTQGETHWEPLSGREKQVDLGLPPEGKRVWRVSQQDGAWVIDYTPEPLDPSPFTTLVWIMNHIAMTGEMYLHCIRTGEPEGVSLRWDDLPIAGQVEPMRQSIYAMLAKTETYLNAIPAEGVTAVLNDLSPAPWGEMRPVYRNIWGGIIGHTLEHASQVAAIKHGIRTGLFSRIPGD